MKLDSEKRHPMRLTKDLPYCLETLEFAGWCRYGLLGPEAVGHEVKRHFDEHGRFWGPDAAGIEPVFYMDTVIVKGRQ
jgi:hypothetical protein